MKKLSITILILAFMASCSNQNKDNNAKDTRYQSATYTKPQNPQGATVALNSTDLGLITILSIIKEQFLQEKLHLISHKKVDISL